MKYSILGFNQEEVLKCKTTIDVNGKEKEVCIDVTDLLILQCVADFMNRQCVYKYIINDKMYFSIHYKALLEDLPILNIGKQALRDRIDKLVLFNLLEKEAIRNEQGSFVVFRIGTRYEQLVYNKKEEGVCIKIEGGVYQTTHGVVENYTPKNSSTINTSTIKEKEDKSSKKKSRIAFDVREDLSYVEEAFVQIWDEWLDYKDEIKKQYKTQRGAKSQYKSLVKYANNNPILANAIVKNSIEHSWDGIFALTDKQVELFLSPKSPYYIDKNNEQQTNKQTSEQVIINGQIYR